MTGNHLSAIYKEILAGKVCPYCKQPSVYVDSNVVHERSYGMVYLCRPCSAWVGVHNGTNEALGRLANQQLRQLKMEAHRWFDPIAKQGLIDEIYDSPLTGISSRNKAYQWLDEKMGMQAQFCHIGMFDEEECQQVINICKPIVEPIEQQTIDPQDL